MRRRVMLWNPERKACRGGGSFFSSDLGVSARGMVAIDQRPPTAAILRQQRRISDRLPSLNQRRLDLLLLLTPRVRLCSMRAYGDVLPADR